MLRKLGKAVAPAVVFLLAGLVVVESLRFLLPVIHRSVQPVGSIAIEVEAGIEDQRSRTTRNASDIAQKAFYKQFPEVAAAAAREKAAQQRAKKEAEEKERRARIRKLENEIRDLENERDNLRGLFMGGKRNKLQAQIDELQRELDFLKR